jgi:hypothetical protein
VRAITIIIGSRAISRRRGCLAPGPGRGRRLGPTQRPPPQRQHPTATPTANPPAMSDGKCTPLTIRTMPGGAARTPTGAAMTGSSRPTPVAKAAGLAQVLDVRAAGFADPQTEQAEQRNQGEIVCGWPTAARRCAAPRSADGSAPAWDTRPTLWSAYILRGRHGENTVHDAGAVEASHD